jgi:hypothetical protein
MLDAVSVYQHVLCTQFIVVQVKEKYLNVVS